MPYFNDLSIGEVTETILPALVHTGLEQGLDFFFCFLQ